MKAKMKILMYIQLNECLFLLKFQAKRLRQRPFYFPNFIFQIFGNGNSFHVLPTKFFGEILHFNTDKYGGGCDINFTNSLLRHKHVFLKQYTNTYYLLVFRTASPSDRTLTA